MEEEIIEQNEMDKDRDRKIHDLEQLATEGRERNERLAKMAEEIKLKDEELTQREIIFKKKVDQIEMSNKVKHESKSSELQSCMDDIKDREKKVEEMDLRVKAELASIKEKNELLAKITEDIEATEAELRSREKKLQRREKTLQDMEATFAASSKDKDGINSGEAKLAEKAANLKKVEESLRKKTSDLQKKERELQKKAEYFKRKVSHIMKTEDEMQKNLVGILSKSQSKQSRYSGSNISDVEHVESIRQSFSQSSSQKSKEHHLDGYERGQSSSSISTLNQPSDVAGMQPSDSSVTTTYSGTIPSGFKNISFVGGRTSSYKPIRFSNKLGPSIRPAILNVQTTPETKKPPRKHRSSKQ